MHNVAVLEDYKPLAVTFNTFNNSVDDAVIMQDTHTGSGYGSKIGKVIDWSKVDESCIQMYRFTLDSMLSHLNIPLGFYSNSGLSDCAQQEIDQYYCSLMQCVMDACKACFPVK